MTVTLTLSDRDRGYSRLVKMAASSPVLRVGIVHDVAHKEGNGKSVGEIAEIHEFGLGNVPMRAWLRPVVDGRRALLKARLARVAEAIALGKATAAQGMNLLGIELVRVIKNRIQAGITPALAESTLRRKTNAKGQVKSTPLINTSQFIGSIDHVLVGPGGAK